MTASRPSPQAESAAGDYTPDGRVESDPRRLVLTESVASGPSVPSGTPPARSRRLPGRAQAASRDATFGGIGRSAVAIACKACL